MPYISVERRPIMDEVVWAMRKAFILADGDLNYILFKYCKEYVVPSYNNYKTYIGELRQCCTEIERRLLAPYEDQEIEKNRDI